MTRSHRQKASPAGHARLNLWLVWALITILYVVLRFHLVAIPLDRDEGAFGLVGRAILEGGVPYVDAIDQKPPVVFFLYALALSLAPPTASGVHLFLHAYNYVTLIVLYLGGRRLLGWEGGLWTALAYTVFSANPAIQGFTASTEMFMLLPLSLSLFFALRVPGDARLLAGLAASGLFGALACWTKQPAVTSVLFVFLYVAYGCYRNARRNGRNAARAVAVGLGAWLAGGLAVSLLIGIYFVSNGAFDEFVYWAFRHSTQYSTEMPYLDRLGMLFDRLWQIVRSSPVLAGGVATGLLCVRRNRAVGLSLIGFLLLSLLGTSLGFAYRHYFAQLAPAMALLCAAGFLEVRRVLSGNVAKRVAVPVLAVGLLAGELLPNVGYYFTTPPDAISRSFFGLNPFPESREIARTLRETSGPDDRVFLFGSEPQILLLAERASASSFVVIYPLMRESFSRHREFQRRVIEELNDAPPAQIIVVQLETSLAWDLKARLEIADYLAALLRRDYQVSARYVPSEDVKGWVAQSHPADGVEAGKSITLFRRKSR